MNLLTLATFWLSIGGIFYPFFLFKFYSLCLGAFASIIDPCITCAGTFEEVSGEPGIVSLFPLLGLFLPLRLQSLWSLMTSLSSMTSTTEPLQPIISLGDCLNSDLPKTHLAEVAWRPA